MRVKRIAAIDVTIGMKLRSFFTPKKYYTVESIQKSTNGQIFNLRHCDGKPSKSFFGNEENCIIRLEDNELTPLDTIIKIICPNCEADFPILKLEHNSSDNRVSCPDCNYEDFTCQFKEVDNA